MQIKYKRARFNCSRNADADIARGIAQGAGGDTRTQNWDMSLIITLRRRCMHLVCCMCHVRNHPRTQARSPCARSGRSRTGIDRCAVPRIHPCRNHRDKSVCTDCRSRRSPICIRTPPARNNRYSLDTDACRWACKHRPRNAILTDSCRRSVLCNDLRNNRGRNAARTNRSLRCACNRRNSPR